MCGKKDLRRSIGVALRSLPVEEREALSARLVGRLERLPRFRAAQVVVAYSSLPDEVSTREAIVRWARQKTVLLPVVQGDRLVLRRFGGEACLHAGAYGIWEPEGADFEDWRSIDLAVVPGRAFDSEGHRLGRGCGYYDRFLSDPAVSGLYKVGFCFPCQLVESVPTCIHDVPMDLVIGSCD